MRVRRCGFVASVLLAATLAGCGSADVSGAAGDNVPTPTPAALDLGYASFTFRMDVGDGEIVRGSGSFRNAPSPITSVTLDESRTADGKTEPSISMVQAGKVTYIQSEEWVEDAPPLAGKWFSVTDETAGLDLAFLQFLGSYEGMADPYQQLHLLQSGTIEVVGPETVDGIATVHKRSTATLNEVWAHPRVSHTIRRGLQDAGLTAEDFATLNRFDAWIDGQGRVVKFEWRDSVDAPEPIIVTTATFDEARAAALAEPDADLVLDHAKFARLGRIAKKAKAGTATVEDLRQAQKLSRDLGLADPVRIT